MAAYAKALEVVSKQLAHNAGLGSIDVLNPLNGGAIEDEEAKTVDVIKAFIGELVLNKKSAVAAATKAACTNFSIDETAREELARPFRLNASVPDGNSKIADLIKSAALDAATKEKYALKAAWTKTLGKVVLNASQKSRRAKLQKVVFNYEIKFHYIGDSRISDITISSQQQEALHNVFSDVNAGMFNVELLEMEREENASDMGDALFSSPFKFENYRSGETCKAAF